MRKFMRSAPPPASPQKHNGLSLTNGVGSRPRRDDHSTPSRYGETGALWEDPDFPTSAASLADRRLAQRVRWLRPHELSARPRFYGDSAVEDAGSLGPAEDVAGTEAAARWRVAEDEDGTAADPGAGVGGALLLAAAALAPTPRLLARIAPPQSFRVGYCGRFTFRFWVFGSWREVCVDDRLPVPVAARAALPHDYTLPLLEKAYAKLHGGYGAMRGGSVARALQELTGGVVQSFAPPQQPRAALLQVVRAALPRCTLLVAGEPAARPRPLPATRPYCVTGLARAHGAVLLRLRTPGARAAWAGAWARGAPQWRTLPDDEREQLARRTADQEHFWMAFEDFARCFGRLDLVHVGPDDWLAEPGLHARRPWRAVLARRRWRRGYNAGGPPRCSTAHTNPQFRVLVPGGADATCHVVVSVTQEYGVGAAAGARLLGIGFAVYEVPAGVGAGAGVPGGRGALAGLRALDVTHWSRAREVATFFTLPPGQYVVVPHAERAHLEAAFLLRIFTDEHTDVWEVNDDNIIVRDIAAEAEAEEKAGVETGAGAVRSDEELDASALRAVLRRAGGGRPSLELCRALVALRDPGVSGRLPVRELPALLTRLALWRAALPPAAPPCRPPCGARARSLSAYELRAALWACGVTASNKVLECLVLRYARGARLPPDAFLLVMARLHLAHERYRCLEAKLKSNPLSLEEMILMTVYS